jgi:hypothetical protein
MELVYIRGVRALERQDKKRYVVHKSGRTVPKRYSGDFLKEWDNEREAPCIIVGNAGIVARMGKQAKAPWRIAVYRHQW